MSTATELSASPFLDIVAGVPCNCAFPLFSEDEVSVVYGKDSLIAVYNTDYTVQLDEGDNFNSFTITPLASLIDKINNLIANDATEINRIVVRRVVPFTTSVTPETVRLVTFLSTEVDRIHQKLIQLKEGLARAITQPGNVSGDEGSPVTLGSPEANALLAWNDTADRLDALSVEELSTMLTIIAGNVPMPTTGQIGYHLRASAANTFAWYGGTEVIASAATVDLVNSKFVVQVSGTAAITSFGTPPQSGDWRIVTFTNAATLTHNATSLILPTGANIVTANGDVAIFYSRSGSGWRCVSYMRANGLPLAQALPPDGSISNAKLGGDITTAGKDLLDDADNGAQLTTLGGSTVGKAVFTASSAQAAREAVGDGLPSLYARHVESTGGYGGSAVASAFTQLALNSLEFNSISGASLSSNRVTLPAGTYFARWSRCFNRTNATKTALYNVTDAAYVYVGRAGYFAQSSYVSGEIGGEAYFTLSGTKSLELRYIAGAAQATDGLGFPSGGGVSEVYGALEIWKVA